MNVRHPETDVNLQNTMMDPIKHMDDAQIVFLKMLYKWCANWLQLIKGDIFGCELYENILRVGKLTRETGTALMHSARSFR